MSTNGNPLSRLLLHPRFVAAAVVLTLIALYAVEKKAVHLPFIAAVYATIAAIAFLLTSRGVFSLYAASALMMITSAASVIKYREKGFDLHVYDFAFTGTDLDAIDFLLSEFGILIWPIAAALLFGFIVLGVVFQINQRSDRSWKHRFVPVIAAIVFLRGTYPADPSEPRYFYYIAGFNASSFYISFLDLPFGTNRSLLEDKLQEIAAPPPFPDKLYCGDPNTLPDIYVVLSESTSNLLQLPRLGIGLTDTEMFRSQDGKMRELYVETYGGGTWVTNFSLMTGLSSTEFGWQAPYLTAVLEGKVNESIPQLLARCGYRTAVQMPMKYNFVNEGPFLKSIGFEDVMDYEKIGANQYVHRDDFYYRAAEEFIGEHRRNDGRPLFFQIQTMFAHSPYDVRINPEVETATLPAFPDNEVAEYVRRVFIAQTDFRTFLRARESEGETRPSVVLEFGDHQASVIKSYVDGDLSDLRSPYYKTFYSVHAFGRSLDMRPFDWKTLDVVFLGASLLEAADLPTSPVFRELADLRDSCGGRYFDCPQRDSLDMHLKRRVASGFLTLP